MFGKEPAVTIGGIAEIIRAVIPMLMLVPVPDAATLY